jgi:WD40 repeat protein
LKSSIYRIFVFVWLLMAGTILLASCREEKTVTVSFAGPVPEGAAARLGKGEISSTAFAPVADALFVGSKVGVINYGASNLQERWQVATHAAVREVAASEDGHRLLIGLDDGALLLLDGEDGSLLESWPGYAEDIGIGALAWAAEPASGSVSAVAGFDDGNMLLLSIGEEEEVQVVGGLPRQGSGISALVFNPDGRILATGNNNGDLYLIDLESQRLLGSLDGHQKRIEDLDWSPDGASLVSGDRGGVVIEWDVELLIAEHVWPAEAERIIDVSYLSDGRRVSMATEGGIIEQWAAGQTVDGQRADFGTDLLALAWEKDGTRAATAGFDGLLRLWSITEDGQWPKEALHTLAGHGGHADQALVAAYHPQDTVLLAGLGNQVMVWDTGRESPPTTFSGHDAPVSAAAWSPDGSRAASADRDGRIYIWDAASGEVVLTLDHHTRLVSDLSWSADGSRLASAGSLADEVVIWNSVDGQIEQILHGDGDGLWSAAWSPDGRRLAAGSTEGIIYLWETADFGMAPERFWQHRAWISGLEWFEDSKRLISSAGDTMVIVWDLEQGTTTLYPGHSAPVRGVALSPDETYAVSAAINGEAIIWGLNPQAEAKITTRLGGHTDGMTATDWSADGRYIATASEDGTVLIWNAKFDNAN